jgi:uridine kinase
MRTCIVGIAGGSGCGKSTLAHHLLACFPGASAIVELDWYYWDLAHVSMAVRERTNFDHPDALETPRILEDLRTLKAGRPVETPCYDFSRHIRLQETRRIEPVPLIVVEGIHAMSLPDLRALEDVSVFVDTAESVRKARRVRRDMAERGRTEEQGKWQYAEFVLPMHMTFVEPCRDQADFIISGESDYDRTAAPLVEAIRARLHPEQAAPSPEGN